MIDPHQEILTAIAKICEKEPFALTEHDVAFLKARYSYLTAEQKEKYADIFKAEKKDSKEKDEYKALVERAKELGIKTHKVSREDLEKMVTEAENKLKEPPEKTE